MENNTEMMTFNMSDEYVEQLQESLKLARRATLKRKLQNLSTEHRVKIRRLSKEESVAGYRQVRILNRAVDCAICLEHVSGHIWELPCKHVFHQECLEEWYATDSRICCPLCRDRETIEVGRIF